MDAAGSNAGTSGKPDAEAGRGGKLAGGGSDGGAGGEVIEHGTGGTLSTAGLPGAGGDGGGSVEPVPVPEDGLELWLRAKRGVVEVGGGVASWKDSSSKGRNATAASSRLFWCRPGRIWALPTSS